jgi:hypothetical protein
MMGEGRPVRADTGLGVGRIVSVHGLYGELLSTRFVLLILRCTANPPPRPDEDVLCFIGLSGDTETAPELPRI